METNNTTQILEGKDALAAFFDGTETPPQETQTVELPISEFFEENPAEAKPVETAPTPAPTPDKPNQYAEQAKFLIEKGYWKDLDVEIEENGEKKLVPISELEMTPELFDQLDEAQKAEQKEAFNSKYIDVEGIDDTTKKLIELKKKGGDITELIQLDAEFVNPIKNLDLENEQVHEYLVRQKYQSLGLEQDIIDFKVDKLKKELTLDVEAKKVADEINSNFDKVVENKLKEREAAVEAQKEEQKNFKKGLSEAYKKLELKDTLVKSLIENAAKFDEYGFSNVDKVFFEAKKDPEKFARIAFHILDEEGYNEFQGVKTKNKIVSQQVDKVLKLRPRDSSQQEVKKTDKLKEFFEQT